MRNLTFPSQRRNLSRMANRLVDDMWTDFTSLANNDAASWVLDSVGSYPKVNLIDSDDSVVIEASIPGLTNDQVSVEYTNGLLTIAGQSVNESEDSSGSYLVRELHKRAFTRSFPVPEEMYDVENIGAKVENGMLTVTIPKRESENNKEETRKIEVK